MRVIALISGGKDSWYAYYLMLLSGFEISCAVTFLPKNKESFMFHHPLAEKVFLQAGYANLKHYGFEVSGKKEKEVVEMKENLRKVVEKENAKGLICGAIRSGYQRQRIDFICEELNLISYFPLWNKEEEKLTREMVEDAGFEFLIAETCAEGIERWKGKVITKENLEDFLSDLKRARCNLSGEGGEYETFLIRAPFFSNVLLPDNNNPAEKSL